MNNANLVLRNVTVTIERRIILDKISLELGPGIHSLVGPNGAGKTTLLKSIAGIIDYEGEILYNGKVLDSLNVAYSPATPIVDPLA
ncbi:MAG: ATP-binding cassette domain-containing protein, partial [Desulfurococcales archaeon]|nr:ATP-binding cassette domain-containing protein [Desulfurococcales archaeon]